MHGELLNDVVVRRWADVVPMPWRNGGGVTRELWRWPVDGDRFDWRVSVAEVSVDGPFSNFDGYDRLIVLLSGAGMDLHGPDSTVLLRPPFGRHRFAGERPILATLPSGPTTDFNLIWRREWGTADVENVRVDGARTIGASALALAFVLDGHVRLAGEELEAGDSARLTGTQRCEGSASLLVCSLTPSRRT
jgi:environmental stress-induced protein Ves